MNTLIILVLTVQATQRWIYGYPNIHTNLLLQLLDDKIMCCSRRLNNVLKLKHNYISRWTVCLNILSAALSWISNAISDCIRGLSPKHSLRNYHSILKNTLKLKHNEISRLPVCLRLIWCANLYFELFLIPKCIGQSELKHESIKKIKCQTSTIQLWRTYWSSNIMEPFLNCL